MSSAISTDGLHDGADGLRPWQFFLLAGMLAATGVVLVSAGQSPASIVVLSLTVVSASFVALGAYRALAPLVLPDAGAAPQLIVGHTRAALEREKTLVLRAIKDLEFDYAMKKVSPRDFEEMSVRLRARAIGLMRQLDTGGGYKDAIERELAARLGHAAAEGTKGAALSDRTEGAASSDRTEGAASSDRTEGAALSDRTEGAARSDRTEGAARSDRTEGAARSDRTEGAALAAPYPATRSASSICSCGTANDPDARFCKNCGTALHAA